MTNEQLTTEEETDCPGCKTSEYVTVLGMGWLFRCRKCGWEYGHPQLMSREDAHAALYDRRNP